VAYIKKLPVPERRDNGGLDPGAGAELRYAPGPYGEVASAYGLSTHDSYIDHA